MEMKTRDNLNDKNNEEISIDSNPVVKYDQWPLSS